MHHPPNTSLMELYWICCYYRENQSGGPYYNKNNIQRNHTSGALVNVEYTKNLHVPHGGREGITERLSAQVQQIKIVMKRKNDKEERTQTNKESSFREFRKGTINNDKIVR